MKFVYPRERGRTDDDLELAEGLVDGLDDVLDLDDHLGQEVRDDLALVFTGTSQR